MDKYTKKIVYYGLYQITIMELKRRLRMEYANYSGLPLALATIFHENIQERELFDSLPEETQQKLLLESIRTPEDFHNCINRLAQKKCSATMARMPIEIQNNMPAWCQLCLIANAINAP